MRIVKLAAMAALALAAATAAEAQVVYQTTRGLIWSGSDTLGLFGAADTDLTGFSYTLTFSEQYDPARTQNISNDGGGDNYSNEQDLLNLTRATMTINGHSVTFDSGAGLYGDTHIRRSIYGPDYMGGILSRVDATAYNFATDTPALVADGMYSAGLMFPTLTATAPLTYDVTSADIDAATAQYGFYGTGFFSYGIGVSDSLNLAAYHVEVGMVPEPASWAVMVVGFGLVGGAMRARRKGAVRFQGA